MPTPAPTPIAEQIVTVAEITMLSSGTVEVMIAADEDQDISDAKWSRTLEDIALWPDIRDEEGDLKKVGSIEFFNVGDTTRLGFRNMVRARYGQPLLISETATAPILVANASVAVPVTADW